MKKKAYRILSSFLAALMVVALLPTGVLAEESENNPAEQDATGNTTPATDVVFEDSQKSDKESAEAYTPVPAETNSVVKESLLEAGAESGVVASGYCGNPSNEGGESSVTWSLDSDGVLTIAGTGTMNGYSYISAAPWKSYSSSIKSVEIGSGVISIGNSAFADCSSLASVYITDLSAWCSFGFENSAANPLSYAHNLYLNNELVTEMVIPADIESIGASAFDGCSSLASVTIPEGVKSIGDSAFSGCSSLASISIPEGVNSIGVWAFSGCGSLASISIPEGVQSIGDYTFYGCASLASISIPEGVNSIGVWAFYNCSKLADVYYGGSAAEWSEISISNGNDLLLNATRYYWDTSVITVTMNDTGRSMSLSDLVYINQYCTIASENLTQSYICSNGGLLVWSSQPAEVSYNSAVINGYVKQGLKATGSEYSQRTDGIIAKNYGSTMFMCIYLRLPDGSYQYTPLKEYGVVTYCNNKLKSATASAELKTMCQDMLDYGASAKAYFASISK